MPDFGYPSIAEYVILFYAAGCGIAFALHIISLFLLEATKDGWILAGSIVLSLFLTLVVLGLLKILVQFLHKKLNVESLKRKKNEILIGLGGITLSSFIPRILVFFFADNVPVLIYTVYLSFGSIFFLLLIFQLPRTSNYKVDYSINGTKCWVASSVIFHALLLIFTIIFGYEVHPKNSESDIVLYVQVIYSVIFGFSSFEFFQVLRGGFKLNINENGTVRYYNEPQNVGRPRYYGNPRNVRRYRNHGSHYETSDYFGDMVLPAMLWSSACHVDSSGSYHCSGGYGGGDHSGGYGGGGDCGGGDGGGGGGCD